MKRKIFAVYDVKAQAYATPFLYNHKPEAIRAFMTASNDPQTNLNKYPADYKLYYLGEFDDQSGKYTSLNIPEYLNTASDFINTKLPQLQTEDLQHVESSN